MKAPNQPTMQELKQQIKTPRAVTFILTHHLIEFKKAQREGFPLQEINKHRTLMNDTSRSLIDAYHIHYGQAWLGKVNLHGDDSGDLWRFEYGTKIYNYGADFVLPCYTEKVESLIKERTSSEYTGTAEDKKSLDAIYKAVEEAGGSSLAWA